MRITDADLIPLKQAGLLISYFSVTKEAERQYSIGKPKSILGNCLPEYSQCLDGETCDAPLVHLREYNSQYRVTVGELVLGGARELEPFELSYKALRDAITAILNYYFGDPTPMYMELGQIIFQEWKTTNESIRVLYEKEKERQKTIVIPKTNLKNAYIKEICEREIDPHLRKLDENKLHTSWTAIIMAEDQVVAYVGGKTKEEAYQRANKAVEMFRKQEEC